VIDHWTPEVAASSRPSTGSRSCACGVTRSDDLRARTAARRLARDIFVTSAASPAARRRLRSGVCQWRRLAVRAVHRAGASARRSEGGRGFAAAILLALASLFVCSITTRGRRTSRA
jgi:hypothetical protein